MVLTVINLFLWVGTVLGYLIFNLNQKNQKLEQMVIERDSILRSLSSTIEESDKVLQELDRIGAFKSDDEIGFFFKTIQSIQQALNQFTTKR
jgi:hypothetical protein